jgi:hypothetical protein
MVLNYVAISFLLPKLQAVSPLNATITSTVDPSWPTVSLNYLCIWAQKDCSAEAIETGTHRITVITIYGNASCYLIAQIYFNTEDKYALLLETCLFKFPVQPIQVEFCLKWHLPACHIFHTLLKCSDFIHIQHKALQHSYTIETSIY